MNDRQHFALTHPVNGERDLPGLHRYRTITDRGDGTLLVVILAVDR